MELKKGYKHTKVGVIPEDWGVLPITKATSEIFLGLTSKVDYVNNGGIPLVRATDIADGKLSFDKTRTISIEQHKSLTRYRKAKRGDVLVSKSGSLGVCAIVDVDHEFSIYESIIVLQPKPMLGSEFLLWLMRDERTQIRMIGEKVGSSVAHLNIEMFRKLAIQIPTLEEQTAIATAISDVDTLIQLLEKLIAKKRAIKQGAMQELLKPKEGWVVKKLGEVATLKARIGWQGLTTAEYKDTGEYFLITGTDFKNGFIDWGNCAYVEHNRYKQDRNIQIKENDVLVTKDGTIGKVAFIKRVPKPATLNSGIFVIRPVEQSFHPEFFYYLLLSETFTKFLSQLSAGSTINHLYQKDFVHFHFQTPVKIEEQISIAAILSDMDAEIAVLESKLAKYKHIKQGMMQNLLTGRIRLI